MNFASFRSVCVGLAFRTGRRDAVPKGRERRSPVRVLRWNEVRRSRYGHAEELPSRTQLHPESDVRALCAAWTDVISDEEIYSHWRYLPRSEIS